MEDRNSFREIMNARVAQVDSDMLNEMERHIERQAQTFSVFSRVVELFVPNALDTAAKMIGGDNVPSDPANHGPSDEPGGQRGRNVNGKQAGWRRKPS